MLILILTKRYSFVRFDTNELITELSDLGQFLLKHSCSSSQAESERSNYWKTCKKRPGTVLLFYFPLLHGRLPPQAVGN